MTQTFTENDLIRFIYKETDEQESKLITEALWEDSRLRAEYGELCLLQQTMDGVLQAPRQASIDRIMDFSKSLDLPPMLN
ncbi:MAG: hypothetical protein AAFQ98_07555 [Bacteroidota bacterium]